MPPATAQAPASAAVAGAGDVNGDGYADFIIGDPSSNGGSGAAYLYFGGPSWQGASPVTFVDPAGSIPTLSLR
jgi:hypothetical protein